MRIINEIIEAEIGYLTVHERRARILAHVRGKGVAFKDVRAFLEKEAIREGYAQSQNAIEVARSNKVTWIVYMDRFVEWVNSSFKAGWIEKKKPTSRNEKKKTENGVVVIPKSLSKKRAEKIIESPESKKAIEEALIESGSIVVDNEIISERLIERLLEKEENERTIINVMRTLGYKITKPKRS